MATYKNFEEMDVWQDARAFCKRINATILSTELKNNNSIRWQLEDSSGSIMDNIAEGFERGSTKEFIQFLSYSKGSCGESRSQLHRAYDAGYLTEELYTSLIQDAKNISKKINGFIQYLLTVKHKGNRFAEEDGVEYGKYSDFDFDLDAISNFQFQISN